MKYISIPVFIFCFAIGILYVYLTAPEPRVVIVYPTPDNKDMFQYKQSFVLYISMCVLTQEEGLSCIKSRL